MYHYVLFDLDGTLTDPKEGICKSVQYALDKLNIHEPDLDKLECFIGPPLTDSLRDFYGLDDTKIEEGIRKYRERYATTGIFENELYPGMKELLEKLSEKGVHLAVASSKPKPFVDRILKHFQIESYFEVVAGGDMDEKKVSKAAVMRGALSKLFDIPEEKILPYEAGYDPKQQGGTEEAETEETETKAVPKPQSGAEETDARKKMKRLLPVDDILMIGDRKYDAEGAKNFYIDCVGVTYGYAQRGELRDAGAEYITDSLDDIYEIITEEKPEKTGAGGSAFRKSYRVLLPLVYDYAITYGLLFLLTLLLDSLLQGVLHRYAGWFAANSSQTAVIMDAFTTVVCAVVFFVLYQKEKRRHISKVIERRITENLIRYGGCIICLGAAVSLFLNLIFALLHIMNASAVYQETASIQYSVSIFTGLVIYGVIKPVEEELLFRGLIYGRMRQYYPVAFCIPASAVIFGAYHINLVQLLYGFIMGCILAWLYEKFRSLKANILFHGAANVTVFLTSMIPLLNQAVFHIVGVAVIGVVMVALMMLLWKKADKLFE